MRSPAVGVALVVALLAGVVMQQWGIGEEWNEAAVLVGLEEPVLGIGAMEELRADQVEEFYSSFWGVKPCIVRGATRHSNAAFVAATRRGPLLRAHGNATLVLSTANTASYEKRSLGLREYVEQLMGPQDEGRSGEETWYQFGDQPAALNPLMAVYELPVAWMRHVNSSALSFGLSGTGTGVPFHTHGAVFAEVFSGRKRWFVAAPEAKPLFEGRNTTLQWYRRVAPSWPGRAGLLQGTCGRGDLLYLPGFWWHSTLNVGQTVFMSVFV